METKATTEAGERTQHTSGPWSCPKGLEVISVDGRVITYIDDGDYLDPTEAEANARLIAAAPELLEHLKRAVACVEHCRKAHKDIQSGTGFPIEQIWKELIAKAEGRAS